MAKDKDGARESTVDPSFNDPHDPRWSQNPHPGASRNPYLDMPLDAPPIGGAPHGSGYPSAPRGPGGGPDAWNHEGPQHGYPQQYQQPGYPAQTQRPSGVLAIVSLVSGIVGLLSLGLLLVPEIVAIICGHMALRREPHMRGVAIGGLITGYLGLLFLLLVGGLVTVGLFASSASYY